MMINKNIMEAQEICKKLDIDYDKVLNIYPYGSRVYGTDDEYSDSDFIIVYNSSFLPSGAFKDNAITSDDGEIQGVCYSRSGFIDAINNFEIGALECIFLPEDKIIQKKLNFDIKKFEKKEFVKKIITKASSSWHFATLAYKDDNIEYVKKNIFHSIRILDFAIQIKENGKIIDYSSMNNFKNIIFNDDTINIMKYYSMFMKYSAKLKS